MKAMQEKDGGASQVLLTFLQPGPAPQPGGHPRVSYRDQQDGIRRTVTRHQAFTRGSLLDTLEKGGTRPSWAVGAPPYHHS